MRRWLQKWCLEKQSEEDTLGELVATLSIWNVMRIKSMQWNLFLDHLMGRDYLQNCSVKVG